MAAQREWYEKDYYKVLGVADDASPKDDHQGLPQAGARAAPRQEPGQRRRRGALQGGVGRLRRARRRGQAQGVRRGAPARADGRPGCPAVGRGGFRFNVDDVRRRRGSATCSGRCSAAAARRAGRRRRRARSAAPTSRPTLTLDFADAVRGITTTLHLTSDAQCSTCHGSRRQARHARRRCARSAAAAASSTTTRACSRSRRRAGAAAAPARSSRTRARRATAPASSAAPARCRRASRPASPTGRRSASRAAVRPGRNGGPAGDLLVECSVDAARALRARRQQPHRAGAGHFAEAALGGDIDVPTLDGPDVTLRLKPGTPVGQPSPRQGQGHRHVASKKGTTTGDLIVTVDVDVPRQLSEEQKAAVEALAAATTVGATDASEGRSDATSNSGRLRHLGRRRAGRHASADAAHLRAARAGQPARTQGGNRRYSDVDIEALRRITELAAEGMNLEGIRRVMELEAEIERLRAELAESRDGGRARRSARPKRASAATSSRCARRWPCSANDPGSSATTASRAAGGARRG